LLSYLFYYGQAQAGAFDPPVCLMPLEHLEILFRIRPLEPLTVVGNRKNVAIPPFFMPDPDTAQLLATVQTSA
jgi:hypothetical protein